MGGGKFYSTFFQNSSQNATVKELLKSASVPLDRQRCHCERTAPRTETVPAIGCLADHAWQWLQSAALWISAPASWHHHINATFFTHKTSF